MNIKGANNEPLGDLDKEITWLQSHLYRWDCPNADEIGDYALSLLDINEMMHVEAHLKTCVACRLELQELKTYLSTDENVQPVPEWRSMIPGRITTSAAAYQLRGTQLAPTEITFDLPNLDTPLVLLLEFTETLGTLVIEGTFAVPPVAEVLLQEALVELWHAGAQRETGQIDQYLSFSLNAPRDEELYLRILTTAEDVLACRIKA